MSETRDTTPTAIAFRRAVTALSRGECPARYRYDKFDHEVLGMLTADVRMVFGDDCQGCEQVYRRDRRECWKKFLLGETSLRPEDVPS